MIKTHDTCEINTTNDADDNDIVRHSSSKCTFENVKNFHHCDNNIVRYAS